MQACRPAPHHLCRAHLERVLSSATFQRAEQLRRLLDWLAVRSLDPAAARPTEKQIAEEVLKRANFDPQTDSLVRKEMARLREKLSRFYLTDGAHDEIRIRATSGYLLKFESCAQAEPAPRSGPCWLILPFRGSSEMREQILLLLDELLLTLGERGLRQIVSPTTALAFGGRSCDVREFAGECGADILVEGSLRHNRNKIEAAAWIVAGQTGRAERSIRVLGDHVGEIASQLASWLLKDRCS